MTLGLVLVPHAGEEPNPLVPAAAEIALQLLVLATLVAVVVLVVRWVLRRGDAPRRTTGHAESLSHTQAYEAAYRFVTDAAHSVDGPRSLAELAESMQPVRDTYEDESPTWAAWRRVVEETVSVRPLPRP